jgi:hypothetical protein
LPKQATRYILDVALESHASLQLKQSELAAAALWLALGPSSSRAESVPTGHRGAVSKLNFERVTGYSVKSLALCCEFLLSLCRDAENYPHLYVHRKHAGARPHIKNILGL